MSPAPSIDRAWLRRAVEILEADAARSADTHLHPFALPESWGINLYWKDESVHPTGSLKHRLARSLFLYALCNGWIGPDTTVVEASSGSTAVSEAYFAQLLSLPFVAVMPECTSHAKVALIERAGGKCHLVKGAADVIPEARRLAALGNGHFLDQFAYAERATDWRGNNNIAESIFTQMRLEPHPVPAWIVVSAGTGGTSATIGRYVRYERHLTRVCVADPEFSAFYDSWVKGDPAFSVEEGSRIEGIGRPTVERSFIPQVVDHMVKVPDAASVAGVRYLEERMGRRVGGSTGTNLWGVVDVCARMRAAGETGSVVSLICDGGDRYADTYFDDGWVEANHLNLKPHLDELARTFG